MATVIKNVKNRATVASDIFYDSVHALIVSDATCSAFERALVTTFFAKFLARISSYNTLENTCLFVIERLQTDQSSDFGYKSVTKSDSLFDTASAAEDSTAFRIKVMVDGELKENHVLNVSANMGNLLFKHIGNCPCTYEFEKGYEWDFVPKDDRGDSVIDNDEIGTGAGTVTATVKEEVPVAPTVTTTKSTKTTTSARIISTPTVSETTDA
jgi:hypothetical protein